MAKKSAKSKGYRKTIEKKPYLTKRDIIILCVILAIVTVGAILLFTYDDGALKVKDGKIVDAGENWLIVNGNARGRRYFKLGEIGEIEGYAMEAQPFVTDENLTQFVFTPEAEDAVPDSREKLTKALKKENLIGLTEQGEDSTIVSYKKLVGGEEKQYCLQTIRSRSSDDHHIVIGVRPRPSA